MMTHDDIHEQLILKQNIGAEEIDRKCNASVVVYTDGHVILQKDIKDVPQWATVGGKVEVSDQAIIMNFASLEGLDRKLVDLLREQFKADRDPIMATFAYAALRKTIEDIGGNNKEFIYSSLLSRQATLVLVDRDSFGIPEANKKFRTEQFYLDFGKMPVAELMANLKASGEVDCQEIVAAPVNQLQTKPTDKAGIFSTTYNELMVRHSLGVVAKHMHALRERIRETARMDTNDLLHTAFTENDALRKADLGAGLCRLYLPKGKANELANWVVVVGKRFNGQLKLSVGGAIESDDNSFYQAACREAQEEQFAQLPITAETNCIAYDICFKPKSGKPRTDGMLYYAFMALETQYTSEQITQAVVVMNQIAPVYFSLNHFLTNLDKATPEELNSDNTKQSADAFLKQSSCLPAAYQFNEALTAELMRLVNGQSTLNLGKKDFSKLSENNVHVHAEYHYFVQVSYLQYQEALKFKKTIACTTPDGTVEELFMFAGNRDAELSFFPQFEATQIKMLNATTTPQFAAISSNTSTNANVEILEAAIIDKTTAFKPSMV